MAHHQGHPMPEQPQAGTNDERWLDSEPEVNHQPSLEHHQNHALLLALSSDGVNPDNLNELYTNHSELQPEGHWKLFAYQMGVQYPTKHQVDGGRIFHSHLDGQKVVQD